MLSASTEEHDRKDKMPIYARESVPFAWLVDPIARSLEAFALTADGRWEEAPRESVLAWLDRDGGGRRVRPAPWVRRGKE